MGDHSSHDSGSNDANRGHAPESRAAPGGLALAANGLPLEPSETRFEPETPTHFEFAARFPTPGRYRLFFQCKPEGTLITASFDVRIEP